MIQIIDDKAVYVVEFTSMPELPIVGTGMDQYYAQALTSAIRQGIIKYPGKYGIEVDFNTMQWHAYELVEPLPVN